MIGKLRPHTSLSTSKKKITYITSDCSWRLLPRLRRLFIFWEKMWQSEWMKEVSCICVHQALLYLLLYLCESCMPQGSPSLSALMCDCWLLLCALRRPVLFPKLNGSAQRVPWLLGHSSLWLLSLYHPILLLMICFCLSLHSPSFFSLLIWNRAVNQKTIVCIKQNEMQDFLFFFFSVFFVFFLFASCIPQKSDTNDWKALGRWSTSSYVGIRGWGDFCCWQIGASYCLQQ